jgi:hypothetical protein
MSERQRHPDRRDGELADFEHAGALADRFPGRLGPALVDGRAP